jgi:cAMP-dependent protein kinase regulator
MKRKREADKFSGHKSSGNNSVPTAQDLQYYLQKNEVESLFVSIMESLCVERPKNVPAFIVQYLQKNFLHEKQNKQKLQISQTESAMPSSWSTFTFGSSSNNDGEQMLDEDEDDFSRYKMISANKANIDDMEEPPLSDVVSENIRRRYSIGGRRVGISNEPIDESDVKVNIPVNQKSEEEMRHIELAITNCSMFSHLSSDDKVTISKAMFSASFEQGDTIMNQGDEGSHFYVIDSGECDVFVNNEFVKTLEPGESFGELALIHGTPRAATIEAKTPVSLWGIDRVTFRKVLMDTTMKKRKLYGNFLRNVEILKTLTDYELQTVADALVQEKWRDREVIVRQNDTGHAFFIIEEGTVNVFKDEILVARLHAGDYFGEMALMFDQPRAATVKASGDVKTVRLDRQSFKRLLGSCEDLLKRNMSVYNMIISKQI